MKKKLLECLNYYKGEKSNPYNWSKDNIRNQFWNYERQFCNLYEHGEYKSMSEKQAFEEYKKELFSHLSSKYDVNDNGKYYRNEYLKNIPK
jgi:hypothetical protein